MLKQLTLLIFGIVPFLFSCPPSQEISDKSSSQHPNIVFILTDDLGYGDTGCYGATKVSTPHIDNLAAEGRRFTDAHSAHSVCTPTRYALLTGRYSWRTWAKHRCVWADDPLLIDTNRFTLPKLLTQEGYHTACIGKWHLGFGSPDSPGWDDRLGPDYNQELKPGPLEVGFDYFYGIPHVSQYPHIFIENHHVLNLDPQDPLSIVLDKRWLQKSGYKDRLNLTPRHTFTGGTAATYQENDLAIHLTEKATDWIAKQQENQPFFLYFAHRNVHGPLDPDERFRGSSQIGIYGDFIHELDWSVGEILQALEQHGFADNTLVIFTSDNGAVAKGHRPATIVDYHGHRANGPLWGQKTEVYEGGHRVPFIARWPGYISRGSTSNHLLSTADILATMSEFFGREIPEGAGEDSYSFLKALFEISSDRPTRTSIVHDSNQGLFAVREGDWKLIFGQGGGGIGWSADAYDHQKPEGQLFNLKEDLQEQKNVFQEKPELVQHLHQVFENIRGTETAPVQLPDQ
ncbi:MAG: arylsulfatase [Bacteroidota bacterium]